MNKSTYEMRYGKPPDMIGVPEWGAPCYIFDHKAGKLDPHAEHVRWMGFDVVTPTKGHQVYSPKSGTICVELAVRVLRLEPDKEEEVFEVNTPTVLWEEVAPSADPGKDGAGSLPEQVGGEVDEDDGSAASGSVNGPRTPPQPLAQLQPLPAPPREPRAKPARRFLQVDQNLRRSSRPPQPVRDVMQGIAASRRIEEAVQIPAVNPPDADEQHGPITTQALFGYTDFVQALVAQHADPELLEPTSHKEAASRPDAAQWLAAEDEERCSLTSKGVYHWVLRSTVAAAGRKVVGSKWVY